LIIKTLAGRLDKNIGNFSSKIAFNFNVVYIEENETRKKL
jgi:hypothetical protein